MNIRIGRIISEPDIEAQLAPNNLMASHSLLYGFDNYCQEGIFTTTRSTISGRFKPESLMAPTSPFGRKIRAVR